jgi:site-specific DNA recombinase
LIDFHQRTDLIHDAVQAERQLRTADSGQNQAERKTIDAQIIATEAAIDRYLTAFENGTLDERTCGHRINDLTAKLGQLKTHRDELDDLVNDLPTPPS